MFKNTAGQQLTVFAFYASNNLPATGQAANLTAYVDKDNAGVQVLADTSAVEKDSTNAAGFYNFDLTQGETNADKLMFSAKCSTSGIVVIAVPGVVYTESPDIAVQVASSAQGQSSIVLAKQGRGVTRDVTLLNVVGDAVVPVTADKLRAYIGREKELGTDLADAPFLVVSGADTPAGSSFQKNTPQSGINRLRIDATDLLFPDGVYTLFVDFYDSNDANEWKAVSRDVFVLEAT